MLQVAYRYCLTKIDTIRIKQMGRISVILDGYKIQPNNDAVEKKCSVFGLRIRGVEDSSEGLQRFYSQAKIKALFLRFC